MAEEKNLQKGKQSQCVEYINANVDELYKGIMVFIITGLKNTVPLVINACPEETVHGAWFSQEFLKCIFQVINIGFFLFGLLLQYFI